LSEAETEVNEVLFRTINTDRYALVFGQLCPHSSRWLMLPRMSASEFPLPFTDASDLAIDQD